MSEWGFVPRLFPNVSRRSHTFLVSLIDSGAFTINFFMSKKFNIHIGKLIEKEVRRQGRSIPWIAQQLNCERTNVYSIFRRESIDTILLLRISVILQHNFFSYYSSEYTVFLSE